MTRRLLPALVCCLAAACGPGPDPTGGAAAARAGDARDVARVAAAVSAALPAAADDAVSRMYRARDSRPLWSDASCAARPAARQARTLLADAADQGLDPAAYDRPVVTAGLARLDDEACPTPVDRARWDVALTQALTRYLHDLHQGRVPADTVGFRVSGPRDTHDFPALIAEAADAGTVDALAEDFVPAAPQYRQLLVELRRYRGLAADPAFAAPLPGPARVDPGDRWAGTPRLRDRLRALGDLTTGTAPTTDDGYAGDLVEALEQFQARHGLDPDGVIGPATRAALDVPLPVRIRQIELALERLRGLPDLPDGPVIEIDIPLFRLWAWDRPRADHPALAMKVIVGRALNTRTPVLGATLESIVFVPYWNVPRSILLGEILPVLARDPAYLGRERMEIVDGPGDDARVVPWSDAALAGLRAGALRVRQRPGAGNALGLVKFVFPNAHDIYMHGTPAQTLFGRARRDFSHGCIRLEDPTGLAVWVLGGQPPWSRDAVEAAMQATSPRTVALDHPIPVLVLYTTAVVTPGDRRLHFAPDIYGHDATLDAALRRYRPDG